MVREPRGKRGDEDPPENFWKGLARDALVAGLIVAVFLGALYAYAGVWPPLVVVESSSMQHGNQESSLGVIDTGDMVFQQAAPARSSVITYIEGRANGYATYGDFGDVIIFRRAGEPIPIIHRAIMFITLHANGTADVPDILLLPTTEWDARNASAPTLSTHDPTFLRSLTIRHMGFRHNINMTFTFGGPQVTNRQGYVTMGDNNALEQCPIPDSCSNGYDNVATIPRLEDVQGRARGEIPWIGLVKLTLQPSDFCCPGGWGDTHAPKNSWDDLLVTLIFLVALPFILEYAGRGWMKFVSPRLPRINWPWRKSKGSGSSPEDAGEAEVDPEGREP